MSTPPQSGCRDIAACLSPPETTSPAEPPIAHRSAPDPSAPRRVPLPDLDLAGAVRDAEHCRSARWAEMPRVGGVLPARRVAPDRHVVGSPDGVCGERRAALLSA